MVVVDLCWFGNIAVPTFTYAIRTGNIKNIEPALHIIVFDEAIPRFKASVTRVLCCSGPVRLKDNSLGCLLNNLALVAGYFPAIGILFDHCNHCECVCSRPCYLSLAKQSIVYRKL